MNGQLAVTGGNRKMLMWNPRRLQIFGVFLLFISVLNNKLLQMGHGSQSILLTMTQWQMYLTALNLEMLV